MTNIFRQAQRFLPTFRQPTAKDMDARTLYALAVLLLLVQIPHLLHLPLWVSATGACLVGLRLLLLRQPHQRLLRWVLAPITVTLLAAGSALLIRADYGYFVGRDPSVAFLFILVAAKFAEVRRASDATLLLCLAAFLLLTQYFYSQSILAAVVTLPAVIALGYCLAVLRDSSNPARTTEQLKLVGKLLLQGIPMATLLFVVFPRLPGPLWSLPEDAKASTGLSDSMTPGSIGELSQSAAVAFRVEFDGQPPASNERYWRGPVLSEFDGRSWKLSKAMIEASPRFNASRSQIVNYTVMLQPHRQRWLFALDAAASLPRTSVSTNASGAAGTSYRTLGRLMSDGQLIATKPVTQVLRYRQQSILLGTIKTSQSPPDNTLFLPGKNTRTHAFAQSLRESSESDLHYASQLLQHFSHEPFYYTLKPQTLGDTPIDEFLFDTRSGFCEHYASAFVVLMRSAGIPARVVTGYLGGEMNKDYMIVRQSDAHAWAEAYIDGAWHRYDPTGAVAPSRVEQGLSAALPNELAVPSMARLEAGWLRDTQLYWDAMNHHWQRLVVDFDNDSQDKLWERLGLAKPALWIITIIVLLLTAAWCMVILGFPDFTRSGKSAVEHAWQRLCRMLTRHGFTRINNESASEFLQRATLRWPNQTDRLSCLDQQFQRMRFEQHSTQSVKRQLHKANKQIFLLNLGLLFASFRFRKHTFSACS